MLKKNIVKKTPLKLANISSCPLEAAETTTTNSIKGKDI